MKKILLVIAILFSASRINAQWVLQNSNISAGFYAQFISAVDPDICWGIVSDPANNLNPVQEYTRTIDGGINWIGGNITNCAGRCPASIFALNADTAWAAMFSGTGGPGTGAIMRTDDGGNTWNQQTTALFTATGNFPDFIYFWDANNGICLGDPTGGYFEIYTTIDGGTTWIRANQAEIPPQLNGEFGITDVFTADHGSTLWFGTNFGRIFKTTDKGYNWTVAQTPFADFIGAIAFRDANNGLCVSGGATGSADVARTTDGGATWTLVGTNTAGMTLKGGLCYVPGTDSTYFISTPFAGTVDGTTFSPNDGNAWIPVDNLIHTDIQFVNDSVGWTGSNEMAAPMFKWSTPITVALNDVASQSIDVATSTGLIIQTPKATIINNGLNVQSFNVTMTISGGYSSTKSISNLAFYNTTQVDFDPWTPSATGNYTINIYTSLGTDSDHNNDTLIKSVDVFEAFPNCGWYDKAPIASGTFGLAGAFYLDGWTSTSPGKLYSVGGAVAGVIATAMQEYSTVSNAWSPSPDMPTGKYQFSANTVGYKIVCAGGYSSGFTPDPNTYVYDISTSLWTVMAPMPIPVGDYASGVYRDSLIYYIGGFDGIQDQDIVQVYDVVNDTWSSASVKPGTPVDALRGAINMDKIVVVGGYSQSLGAPVSEAYIGAIDALNPLNITWTALPDYPAGRASRLGAGSVFMDLRPLVIFTGGDPTGAGQEGLADTWGYDINANQWLIGSAKTTGVSNISNLCGVIANDTLWMACVAGYNGNGVFGTQNEWLCLGPQVWTGVNEHSLTAAQGSLFLYPNPAAEKLTIGIGQGAFTGVQIFNVLGENVLTLTQQNLTMRSQSVTIDISGLKPGVYSVRGTTDSGISNATFVRSENR
ncbi:MAG: T9SS type A sorting domain-containing protein [Bacteroidetes bacterium]|nr:T9SS type A sorting domain-containing protein [Bacteroidota bacterium]